MVSVENIDRSRYEPHLFMVRHSSFSRDAGAWPCAVYVAGIEKLASLDGMKGFAD